MENWYTKLFKGASLGKSKKGFSANTYVGMGVAVFFIVIIAQMIETFLNGTTFVSAIVNNIKPYVVPLMFLLVLVVVGKGAGGRR